MTKTFYLLLKLYKLLHLKLIIMQSITEIVEMEEVKQRHTLRLKCSTQLQAAIKSGNKLGAIVLVMTLFSYNIVRSTHIVTFVRHDNKTFCEAEVLTEQVT